MGSCGRTSIIASIASLALTWCCAEGGLARGQDGSIGGSVGGSSGGAISMPADRSGGSGTGAKRKPLVRAHASQSGPREPAPQRRFERAPRAAGQQRGSTSSFDGAWGISFNAGCAAGNGQVMISGGHISGQNVSGTVGPGGSVRTVGVSEGMSTTGNGHISGSSGSGTFQRTDGCTGSWSAYKM